jgi:NAD+ synthase (glutamine-hydrolysing)
MSGRLRIALAQFDFPVGAVESNAKRIAAMVAEARDVHGADLVLFPELAISGYPPEDLLLRPAFLAACERAIAEVAAACTGGIAAVVGWPQAAGAVVYNAASVLRDGGIERTYRKRELPNYAVFDERRYFAVDPDGGACCFEVKGVQVGLVICEDLWFAEPLAETAALGAELVVVPNASPFESDKTAQRDALLAQRVQETGVALAYLNVVGGQDELVFDGASVLADGDGGVHPAARAFEDHWLVADFDAGSRRFAPVRWPAEEDEGRESLAYRAIVRGIRDYCGKNGFDRVWLGLSGGIDSGLVLALAVDALGARNVAAVRLPSRYTSDLSNDLADEQARLLGVRLETIAIEAPFTGFLDALAPLFDGLPPGVAEENLQSRSRGALMMALSNRFGGLLLTTGNKSEYAVGYATIYGDMCGGFAPIKDLYKTEVQALCRWRNAQSPAIPDEVITRPPSAELRENQTDQDSLPPYDVLDGILSRHVDQEQSLAEITGDGFDRATVERVLRLVRISEWKRRQAAPGPKLSRRAFGRERRYPITSGWRD